MFKAVRFVTVLSGGALLSAATHAQVPDLLNAYAAAGRSMGMAGALDSTDPSTLSAFYNPASLGFVDMKTFGAGYSNLPSSVTLITNTRTNPHYDTQATSGSQTLTHIGLITPMADFVRNGKGALALTYTVGGFMDDSGFGPQAGLPDGPLTINNYRLRRQARSDYYTLAYGLANSSSSASWGIGLTYVVQHISYVETGSAVDSSGNSTPFTGANDNFDANGVGVVVGGQFIPPKSPNFSFGASFRTPIHLNNTGPGGVFDTIPARAIAGLAYRRDGLGGGDDFIVFGSQLQYFFGGDSSLAFDRSNQTGLGVGLEYNHSFSSWRLPLRVGYETLGPGGSGFGSRNVFTYGLGFRPNQGTYSVDLNWGSPQGGGRDFGISASYRFK